MANTIKKLTIDECESFMRDKDNKILYPTIWKWIEVHYNYEMNGESQYLVEHREEQV